MKNNACEMHSEPSMDSNENDDITEDIHCKHTDQTIFSGPHVGFLPLKNFGQL